MGNRFADPVGEVVRGDLCLFNVVVTPTLKNSLDDLLLIATCDD